MNQLITELPGLVAYYPHTEGTGTTLNDNIGSYNGTISGATWRKNVNGFYALDYDGTNDKTNTTFNLTSVIGNGGDFTISLWIKPDVLNVLQRFVSVRNSYGAFVMQINSSGSTVTIIVYDGALTKFTTSIDTGWHMITVTATSTSASGYIDGELISTDATFTGQDWFNGDLLKLGTNWVDSAWYNGKMTNVMIANQAWSADLIKQIYRKTYIQ